MSDDFPIRTVSTIVLYITIMMGLHVPGLVAACWSDQSNSAWTFIYVITACDVTLNTLYVLCQLPMLMLCTGGFEWQLMILGSTSLVLNFIIKAATMPIGVWLIFTGSWSWLALFLLCTYTLINHLFLIMSVAIIRENVQKLE